MQHNLEQLGPGGFQDLAAALAIAEFGPQVQALGSGRDGGRDMCCDGSLTWSGTDGSHAETWDGYTVFQVKQKEQIDSVQQKNAEWLWRQVKRELETWADPEKGRNPVPDYMVIVSNVPLTPYPGAGGIDSLNRNIKNFITSFDDVTRDIGDGHDRRARKVRMSRIRDWRIWDGNQIDALITKHQSVRRNFKAFLTVGDLFASLAAVTDRLPVEQLEPGLRTHARTQLTGEHYIYFDEAGYGDGIGTPLEDVAIDLPIATPTGGKPSTVFGYVLGRGERVLKSDPRLVVGPRHIVIVGGPGNGKTTISKFLVQAFRAALLADAASLSDDHRSIIDGTRKTLKSMGRTGLPKHRRWPMRIDLAEYAAEQGLDEEATLLQWIAHKVSKRSNVGMVTPGALDSWMKQWPWFLVLDGLDEVTEPHIRKRLIRQITEFVTDADGDNCDLLVIVTTRPTGYVENIAPTQFERIDLSHLEIGQALSYGMRATQVRLKSDLDKIDRIAAQLHQAADSDALQNLMRTPLQVLIMTIIIEGAGRLAPDRYSLFWGYFETVLRRERSKVGSFARLLQENSSHILDLHQRVGFELQVRSESSDGSMATMRPDELKRIAWQVLHEAGFKPSEADAGLLDKIVTAATHRLVLLAPHGSDGLGFDVRSLQELMAAKWMTSGTPDAVRKRLAVAAASPHWRNSWIFAAGSIFADPRVHEQEALVYLVEHVDEEAPRRLGSICPVGPALALDLVDDGMARAYPRFFDRLLSQAFKILEAPQITDPLAVARAFVRASRADRVRVTIADALRAGLSGSPAAQETSASVIALLGTANREVGAGIRPLTLAGLKPKGTRAARAGEYEHAWNQYRTELQEWPSTPAVRGCVEYADQAVRRLLAVGESESEGAALQDALADDEVAQILEWALGRVAIHEPTLVATLRDGPIQAINRLPIGEVLR
ncbi:NACHT domain-containing protein [Rhodococcus koreensis]